MERDRSEVTCKDVESFLQPYLEGKLNNHDTKTLLGHLENCSECMDELEIRYLLHEGLKRLENGHDLNLKQELEDRIYNSGQHLLMIERFKVSIVMLSVALIIFAAVQAILMIVVTI